MMNILIIKNSPVQTISFILKKLKEKYPDARLYVLSHEHAVPAMEEFKDISRVFSYRSKDIFSYRKLETVVLNELRALQFERVYFYLAESKKNRFDNLLYLGKRLIGWYGRVIGINNHGEEQLFLLSDTLKYFANQYGAQLLAVPVFFILLMVSPLLYLFSIGKHYFSTLNRLEKEGRRR